jgi:aspartate dehydrogenase
MCRSAADTSGSLSIQLTSATSCDTAELNGVSVVTGIEGLCGGRPDVVVECAGQGSVKEYGRAVLERGIDLAVISTGAFTDVRLYQVDARQGAC